MVARTNRMLWIIGTLAACLALLAGIVFAQHYYNGQEATIDSSQFSGTVLSQPREVSAFELRGIDETTFSNAQLKGKWTFMFFGFTNCGHVCPTTMAELAKMYRLLQEQGANVLPRVVMISIDPERDSREKLRNYVKAFNADFYGARGQENQIKPLAQELGIAYAKVTTAQRNDAKWYDIQHTGAIMLFNPKGELAAFFTSPHHADMLAKDYRNLLKIS